MTRIVNIEEAKSRLQDLLVLALNGDEIIITQGGEPLARIIPFAITRSDDTIHVSEAKDNHLPELRPFGLCAGEFVVPEDFDEPLPQDVLELFEGR